ncbi:NACHT domain-containing protein [Synechocystis sp. LKSZ1]|uniref:NACHT C-terminal helical domain 2-containing protein n=1 Tax=Synechocystis sp. LKSZ1 TaxID=3144951 RepID=UPI00336C2F47
MVKRSLCASEQGIARLKQCLLRKGWTQDYLAEQAGLSTRNSVWKLLSGRAIDRKIFMEICFQLDLDWEDIADLPQFNELEEPDEPKGPTSPASPPELTPESLISRLRPLLVTDLQKQPGQRNPWLGGPPARSLNHSYVEVKVQTRLSHQQWLGIQDLQALRPASTPAQSLVDLLVGQNRILVLGHPGAGKTTLLQHLALLYAQGKGPADHLPGLVSLQAWAIAARHPAFNGLEDYLGHLWQGYSLSASQLQGLLQTGQILLLLDGLDEIPDFDQGERYQQLQYFLTLYPQTPVVMTGRLGYSVYPLPGFMAVEMERFQPTQIEGFIRHWFADSSPARAEQLIEVLNQRQHQALRLLAQTPLLLNLICTVFQDRGDLPPQRAPLYQAALEILLEQWDRNRGIQRQPQNPSFSLADKLTLLGDLALVTLEQGQVFFEKQTVLGLISDYLVRLPGAPPGGEGLWLQSEAILQEMEAHHGLLVERAKNIYAFSHQTFQSYLSARKIVAQARQGNLGQDWQWLTNRMLDPAWQEVIVLVANLLTNADSLFQHLQGSIQRFSQGQPLLTAFLHHLDQKVQALRQSYPPAALRAFYFSLWYNQDFSLAIALEPALAGQLPRELGLDFSFHRLGCLTQKLTTQFDLEQALNLYFALDLEGRFSLNPDCQRAWQILKNSLPTPTQDPQALENWWQSQGGDWLTQLQQLLQQQRAWFTLPPLTPPAQQVFDQYYQVNQFLVYCLQSQGQLSPALQAQLLTELLR